MPGIRQRDADVSFYSRTYPQETQNIEKAADRQWVWSVYSEETLKHRKRHDELNEPLVDAAAVSGDLEPTGTPTGGDITDAIRLKARELGLGKLGSPSLIVGIRTPARNAGSSMSMLSAWHWNKTTSRRSPSPAWTLSLPTSVRMKLKGRCYWILPITFVLSGIMPRFIVPMTTVRRTSQCSSPRVWASWVLMASFFPPFWLQSPYCTHYHRRSCHV